MNHTIFKIGLLSCCLFLLSCSGNKKENSNGIQKEEEKMKAETPYAEEESENQFSATLANKNYSISIVRKSDKTLPIVVDDMGKQYYDNKVNVVITCNGEAFFEKSYTKDSFSDFLSSSETQGTVLLGMAFDQVKSDSHAIYLGAQIGQVGIEEGPAFSVEIPLDGTASSILRDKNQDSTGDDGLGD